MKIEERSDLVFITSGAYRLFILAPFQLVRYFPPQDCACTVLNNNLRQQIALSFHPYPEVNVKIRIKANVMKRKFKVYDGFEEILNQNCRTSQQKSLQVAIPDPF